MRKKIVNNVSEGNETAFPYSRIVIFSLFPLAVLIKLFQFLILPEKYFYDSRHILMLMNTENIGGGSYNNSALLFKTINFFNFDSLLQWSLLFTVVFNFLLFAYFYRSKLMSLYDMILSFCFIGLLDLYVFNLSKDIIQFFLFICIYYIATRKIKISVKIIFTCVIFCIESVFFRSYYILTAAFLLAFVIIMPAIIRKENKITVLGVIKILLLIFLGLYVFLVLCRWIMPSEYNELIYIRSRLTLGRIGDESAQTLILNLIPNYNNSLLIFIFNYLINLVRLFFPVELLSKGMYYWAFAFFQILCSLRFIQIFFSYRKLSGVKRIYLYTMLAYYIVGVFFEPDFGSFVRHEAATAPILFNLLIIEPDLCGREKNG